MKRTIKIIAAVLAATAIGVAAYDRSHSRDDAAPPDSSVFHVATATTFGRYHVHASPKTVVGLARNRNGCAPTDAVPARTVCDIAIAFPDVGLFGTVTFFSSSQERETR